MQQLEPHVFAILKAADTACEIVELLPECDMVEELKMVVNIQHEILCEMVNGRHFGSSQLERYISYLDDTLQNAERIRKCR